MMNYALEQLFDPSLFSICAEEEGRGRKWERKHFHIFHKQFLSKQIKKLDNMKRELLVFTVLYSENIVTAARGERESRKKKIPQERGATGENTSYLPTGVEE